MKKLKQYDWLKKHLEKLISLDSALEKFLENNCTLFNEYGAWTALKLIFLTYVIDIYTTIISKQPWCKNMVYIDFLAGAGVTKIRETGDKISGSPLIALILPKSSFNTIFLCETDSDKVRTLKKGFENLKNAGLYKESDTKIELIQEDCKKAIDHILSGLKGGSHFLAFIDCQGGFELNWEMLQKLLDANGDIVINFQTTQIWRVIAKAKYGGKGSQKLGELLDGFFGDDSWKKMNGEEDLLNVYIDKIKNCDKLTENVKIRRDGAGRFWYHLIFITSPTKTGSPWFKGVTAGRDQIEKYGSKAVKEMLDIIKGRQKTL